MSHNCSSVSGGVSVIMPPGDWFMEVVDQLWSTLMPLYGNVICRGGHYHTHASCVGWAFITTGGKGGVAGAVIVWGVKERLDR